MKPTITTGLAAILLLFAISCTKETIHNSSAVSTQSADNAVTFTIGQHYGGGIIFYIDSTGQHGLIADTVDLTGGTYTWWNGGFATTGATATKIGSGLKNTKKIVRVQGRPGRYAALNCLDNNANGYSDWYLPSKNELIKLYKQKNVVGGFVSSDYWSSSEFISSAAWYVGFTNGASVDVTNKDHSLHVRAVRAF